MADLGLIETGNTLTTPDLWITRRGAPPACWGVVMAVHQTSDLRRLGIGPTQLRRMVRDNELERLRRGAYVDPEVLDQAARHLRLIEATIPQLSGDVILSHASAGVIHGLPVPEALLGQVWVTGRSKGGGHSRPALHELKAALRPGDVIGLGSLRVTSLARTVVDLGRRLRFDDTVVAADAALHAGLDPSSLAEQLDAWPRRRGIGLARKALAMADGRSESPGETRSRVLMWRLGLPAPTLQYEVQTAGGLFRSDFAWEDRRLLGEFDGRVKYGELLRPGERAEDVVMREKHRETLLRSEGWWVVRWVMADLHDPVGFRRIIETGFANALRS